MPVPGFTADATLYRSTRTYRPFAGNTPDRTTGLTPQDAHVDWYDCSGKADGNYPHPYECTKFMSCVAQEYAYERNCAVCAYDPVRCPNGRTHYDPASDVLPLGKRGRLRHRQLTATKSPSVNRPTSTSWRPHSVDPRRPPDGPREHGRRPRPANGAGPSVDRQVGMPLRRALF